MERVEETAGRVLESARPLSESIIWRAQNRYYEGAAQDAWASGDVPYTLTSGPILARTYARLIEAFARDCLRGALGAVDPSAPLYVVELGAGTGRLAFEVLLALDRAVLEPLHLVYVLTDRVARNVAAIGAHPMLASLIAAGEVDVAQLVAGAPGEIRLQHAGELLAPTVNPVVLVANYLFDVIPQDLFNTGSGTLVEELVTTCAEGALPEPGEEDFFRRIFLAVSERPVPPHRYGGSLLDRILDESAALRPPGRFLFPADALRALQQLLVLSGDRLLCLIGERPGRVPLQAPAADAVADAIRADPEIRPGPAVLRSAGLEAHRPGALLAMGVHGGSMSLPVDLSVLARAGAPRTVLLPEAPPSALLVAAMVFGERAPAAELRRAYRRAVTEVGPEDVYLLVKAALSGRVGHSSHAEHLAVLRSGGYDPYLLRLNAEAFADDDGELDDAQLEELARVLERTWEHDYPIEETDLAAGIASILAPAGAYAAALRYYERSAERVGRRAENSYNAALCELHLGHPVEAASALTQAIALDSSYAPARVLVAQLRRERERDRRQGRSASP